MRVVEDHPDTLEIICRMLDDLGADVATRRPDLDVLRADAWEGVKAALVDLNLNRTFSGFDVLRYLLTNFPSVKRIVISAWPGGFAEQAAFIEEGLAHEVLTKPFTTKTLALALGLGEVA